MIFQIHDQFRDDEQHHFRELQRDLEANAKNCRVLQFKLRKLERTNEQLESERLQLEEKVQWLVVCAVSATIFRSGIYTESEVKKPVNSTTGTNGRA